MAISNLNRSRTQVNTFFAFMLGRRPVMGTGRRQVAAPQRGGKPCQPIAWRGPPACLLACFGRPPASTVGVAEDRQAVLIDAGGWAAVRGSAFGSVDYLVEVEKADSQHDQKRNCHQGSVPTGMQSGIVHRNLQQNRASCTRRIHAIEYLIGHGLENP